MAKDVAQLIDHLPGMSKQLGFSAQQRTKPRMAAHACNLSTEAEAGE